MNVGWKAAIAVVVMALMGLAGPAHAQPDNGDGDDGFILVPPYPDGKGTLDPNYPLRPIEIIPDPGRLNGAG
jgi:hypothetical protein